MAMVASKAFSKLSGLLVSELDDAIIESWHCVVLRLLKVFKIDVVNFFLLVVSA